MTSTATIPIIPSSSSATIQPPSHSHSHTNTHPDTHSLSDTHSHPGATHSFSSLHEHSLLQQDLHSIEELLIEYDKEYQEKKLGYNKKIHDLMEQYTTRRKSLLESNKSELQELYDERRRSELSVCDSIIEAERKYSSELESIRWHDTQDYILLRNELEKSIHTFEIQLSEMKSVYGLNSEKLEYNHIVLNERDAENKAQMEQYRVRLRKLKDTLNIYIQRYKEAQSQWMESNKKVSGEYSRTANLLTELQHKFIDAEQVEYRQRMEIWKLNYTQAKYQIEKLYTAAGLIHKQILMTDDKVVENTNGNQQLLDNRSSNTYTMKNPMNDLMNLNMNPSMSNEFNVHASNGIQYTLEECTAVIDMLLHHCQYFIPTTRTGEKSSNDGSSAAAAESLDEFNEIALRDKLLSADTLLSAFGVEDADDLTKLIGYFLPYVNNDVNNNSSNSNVTESSSEINNSKSHTTDHDIQGAIQKYLATLAPQHHHNHTASSITSSSSSSHTGTGGMSQHTATKRQQQQQREREYWLSLADIYRDESTRIWPVLESSLQKYNTVLSERHQMIQQTADLARENNGLRQLLQQYR